MHRVREQVSAGLHRWQLPHDLPHDGAVPDQPDVNVRLYTVAELARLWGVGKTYIYDEIQAGRLPAVRLGRGDRNKLRVSARDAAAWVDARRT